MNREWFLSNTGACGASVQASGHACFGCRFCSIHLLCAWRKHWGAGAKSSLQLVAFLQCTRTRKSEPETEHDGRMRFRTARSKKVAETSKRVLKWQPRAPWPLKRTAPEQSDRISDRSTLTKQHVRPSLAVPVQHVPWQLDVVVCWQRHFAVLAEAPIVVLICVFPTGTAVLLEKPRAMSWHGFFWGLVVLELLLLFCSMDVLSGESGDGVFGCVPYCTGHV